MNSLEVSGRFPWKPLALMAQPALFLLLHFDKEYKICDDRDPLLQVTICKKSFMEIISLFQANSLTVFRSGDPLTNMPSVLF